jgi:Cd2+/Zn2+-exporting ATPase
MEGVSRALVDFSVQKLTIETRDSARWEDILARTSGIIKRLESSVELRDRVLFPNRSVANDKARAASVKDWFRRISLSLGAILFVLGLVFDYVPSIPLPSLMRLALFLTSYLLVGGEVLIKAIKNSTKGEIFDENFLMVSPLSESLPLANILKARR